MTRQPHDQFAKQYLEELLSPFGTVEVSREITDETRQIDVLFSPNPDVLTYSPVKLSCDGVIVHLWLSGSFFNSISLRVLEER